MIFIYYLICVCVVSSIVGELIIRSFDLRPKRRTNTYGGHYEEVSSPVNSDHDSSPDGLR